MAAGLTLVFGVMDTLNLAHGSLFMAGGYGAALAQSYTGSFITALVFGVLLAGVAGVLLEAVLVKHLYRRDHLTQVLATFGVVLIAEDLVKVIFGSAPLLMQTPPWLAAPINLMAGFGYPSYRAFVLACGLLAVVGLFSLLKYSRLGMQLRAGAFDRPMAELMGVRVRSIFTATFALGAALAGLAGALLGPLTAVQPGMGESILIPALVVIVIGGVGSISGALVGSLLVGLVDTAGRAFLPMFASMVLPPGPATDVGNGVANILMYLLMAMVLAFRPMGLFPART
uniref:ABC transporter permease n=2 Tax=Comamonas testosteroni TaxID=285 RepID=G9C9E7_COMTE|nr:ABC transporter permease [Comamonas testosteroni]